MVSYKGGCGLPFCSTLAEVEALIGHAEVQLAAHKLRLKHEGRAPNPSDSFDQVGRLNLWLAVLRGLQSELRAAPERN